MGGHDTDLPTCGNGTLAEAATSPGTSTLLGEASAPREPQVCLCAQMSLLNCLGAAIPARERVVTCEEVFELREVMPEAAPAGPDRSRSRARR
jgi:hypothetical protein